MRRVMTALFVTMIVSGAVALGADDPARKPITNKRCPVMNSDASEKYRTEYNGQFVYFCCEGCIKMFGKDPAGYIAKLSPEDQEAIKVNDLCPVTDEKIAERTFFLEHEGRKIYFCCAGCSEMYKQKLAEKKTN